MDSASDFRVGIEAALSVVAAEGFCALVETAPADWRADCAPDSKWLEAKVAFRGTTNGTITCRLPRLLAADCAAAFLGASDDELSDAVLTDMVGELSNMVCGVWLSRTYPAGLFQLEHPEHAVVAEAPGDDWLVVSVNGLPLGVSATLEPRTS
jgi:hypothetical protein